MSNLEELNALYRDTLARAEGESANEGSEHQDPDTWLLARGPHFGCGRPAVIAGTERRDAEIALEAAARAEAAARGISGVQYKKKIVVELPYRFPDYAAAHARMKEVHPTVGRPYPQGIAFDASGNLYISYISTSWARISQGIVPIVRYDSTFSYTGYLFVPYGLESLVVLDRDGHRYLYHRRSYKNTLMQYDITDAEWNGEVLAGVETLRDLDSNYWYDNGKWYALQIFADVAGGKSRTRIGVFDENFEYSGAFSLPKMLTGWQTNDDEYYNYVPKMQGFCVKDNVVYISHGGHAFHRETSAYHRVSDIGCSAVSVDGSSVLAYGVLDSRKFAARLREMGYALTRTEAEANCVHPVTREIYNIYILQAGDDEGVEEGGVLIVKEFAFDGEDFSDCASSFSPYLLDRYNYLILPRYGEWDEERETTRRAVRNPVTGEKITKLSQLLDFMTECEVCCVRFYTSSITFETIYPIDLSTGYLVELRNGNNYSVEVLVQGASGTTFYAAYKSESSASGWAAERSYPVSRRFDLDVTGSSPNDSLYMGRIVSTIPVQGEGHNVVLTAVRVGNNTETQLQIGGGSSAFKRMDSVAFFASKGTTATDEDAGDMEGDRLLMLASKRVRPGTELDGEVDLGRSDARWGAVYAATGSIQTSDERRKDRIENIPAEVLDAWGEVNWMQFRLTEAVANKGGAARTHTGLIAQRVRDVFAGSGLDASRYGLFCHDEWGNQYEEFEAEGGRRLVKKAGDAYSIRYDEALAMEAAYLRRRCRMLEDRVAALESRMSE